jgi:putative transposase
MRKERPRLRSFDYIGSYRYFLTFCTAKRHRAFIASSVVDATFDQILRASDENQFQIPAYCFMPDHLHLLAEGMSAEADLRRFAKAAKQYSGFEYKRAHGKKLWQPSYHDRVLRADDDTWSVARYILENPLSDGLVERADDYPFLGSAIVSKQELIFFVQSSKPWTPA